VWIEVNILIVSPPPAGISVGGGGRVEMELSRFLLKKGHHVIIIATAYGRSMVNSLKSDLRMDTIKGIHILRLPLFPPLSAYPMTDPFMPPSPKSLLALHRWLSNNLNKADVVHIFDFGEPLTTYMELLLAHIGKPPYVVTLHALPNPYYSRMLRYSLGVYERTFGKVIFRNTCTVTALSHSVAKEFMTRYSALTNRVIVIPNGILLKEIKKNIKRMHNDELLRKKIKLRLHIPKDHQIVFSLGRLIPNKGFDVLIRALGIVNEKIKNVTLVIAGETYVYLDYLQRIARKENVNVKFVGFIEEKMKYELLKTADVVAIPSLKEGFGLVALEAMAAGAPIVASKCSGLRDILKHKETALLTTPANEVELASAITRLLSDTQLRRRLSKAGQKEVEKYDWNSIVNRYIEVYESVVKH